VAKVLGTKKLKGVFMFRGRILPVQVNQSSVHDALPRPSQVGAKDVVMADIDGKFNDLDEAFIRMHPIFIGRAPKGGMPVNGDLVWVNFARPIGDAAGERFGHYLEPVKEDETVGGYLTAKNRKDAFVKFSAELRMDRPAPEPWTAPSSLPEHILLMGDIFSDDTSGFGRDNDLAKAVMSTFTGFYRDIDKYRSKPPGRRKSTLALARKYGIPGDIVELALEKIGKSAIPKSLQFTNVAVARTDSTFWDKNRKGLYKYRKPLLFLPPAQIHAMAEQTGISWNRLSTAQKSIYEGITKFDMPVAGSDVVDALLRVPSTPENPGLPSDEVPPGLKKIDFVIYGGPNDDLAVPGWAERAAGGKKAESEMQPIWDPTYLANIPYKAIWDYLTDSLSDKVAKQMAEPLKNSIEAISGVEKGVLVVGPLLKFGPVPANHLEDTSRYMMWQKMEYQDPTIFRNISFPQPQAGLSQLINRNTSGPMDVMGHPHHEVREFYSHMMLTHKLVQEATDAGQVRVVAPYFDGDLLSEDARRINGLEKIYGQIEGTSNPSKGKAAKGWASYILWRFLEAYADDFDEYFGGMDPDFERPYPEYGLNENRKLRKQLTRINKLKSRVNELLAKVYKKGGPTPGFLGGASLPLSVKEEKEFNDAINELNQIAWDWDSQGGKELK
ncbi:MAG: hypothetical protein VX879_05255, partial [Pseudomonadota bacterium]|nr:hypothetical protein [Pseudomonadota bacterium]